jgi:L-lactate dehydrogenase complex protein LldG
LSDQLTNKETRRAILESIRTHLAASATADAVYAEQDHNVKIPESRLVPYVTQRHGSVEDFFSDSVTAVGGHCRVVRGENEAAAYLAQIIGETSAKTIAISEAPLVGRLIEKTRTSATVLENCRPPALFDCDLGITGAQWAVAETGTLVLESNTEHHRLASLVPPIHVAILEDGQIRETLAEVLHSIEEQGKDEMSRTITFITGPSRTSDIELTLAIGVHGPAKLYVIVIA